MLSGETEKEYCAMRSSLMLVRLRKPLRRSKRRRVRFGTAHLSMILALTIHSSNPSTWSPTMTCLSLKMRGVRLQSPLGEHSSLSVSKATKNDKVTKKTPKKETATSVKQLKAKPVKDESEGEGDDIQEVEQEGVEEGGSTALS
jgi:hypothetical protein